MKLALGTAQFGMNYNVAGSGMVTSKEISNILEYARKNGIDTIDTAIGYGEAEKKLGNADVSGFKVYTKIPKIVNHVNISEYINNEVEKSLNTLKINNLDGVLLHNPSDIYNDKNNEIINAINKLKRQKKVLNFGYSVYSPEEVDKLNGLYKPDLFQLPYNIFDRRFEKTDKIKNLKNSSIGVFVRSIFLQGILLHKNPQEINNYFGNWSPIFKSWNQWLYNNNYDSLSVCVNFIKKNSHIDKIIVGLDSKDQLKSILDAYNKIDISYPENLYVDDLELIDPRNWSR